MKFKKVLVYLFFLIFIGVGLVSCGNKEKGGNNGVAEKEDNKFYIDSFDYEVVKNESAVSNELSYSFSFEIDFSLNLNSDIRDLVVRIAGTQEKSFRFTIDYCNTEHITLSQSTAAYPYALLNYSASKEVTSFKATVRLKISTVDLIDDINKFLKIDCYNNKGSEIVDLNGLTDHGAFKMNYSDGSSSDIIHYAFNDLTESYEIVSVITKSKSFEIPAMYMDYPVKTIDEGAFKAATDIEELVLPKTITSIPEGLLNGMSKLKSLSLPYVGQRIRETGQMLGTFGYIFGNTEYIDSIKVKQVSKDVNNTILEYECCLPKNLTKVIVTGDDAIPYGAFSNCSMLEEIQLTGNIQEISAEAFSNCVNVSSFSLPNTVTTIGDSAFQYFASESDLDYFTLPESILKIGEHAFLGCDAITFELPKSFIESELQISYIGIGISSVAIPYGITSFKEEAFKGFNTLNKISIPKSVKSFGKNAFDACVQIKSVVYEGSLQEWSQLIFADARSNPLSYGNANLYVGGVMTDTVTSLEFTDTILNINDYAFSGVQNIRSVRLENVVTIGKSAFANTPIETIAFGNQLETIGEDAFRDCKKITSLKLPNSIVSIGSNAFYGMNLNELSTPFIGQTKVENTFIGYWFGGTSYLGNKTSMPATLNKITITNLTSIPSYAFSGCSNIGTVSLESNVIEIKDHAFESCTSLKTIKLNDNLETIGNAAFLDCIALESIVIPSGVKTIEKEAFSGCAQLSDLKFKCKNAIVKKNAFMDCSSITSLILNNEIESFEEGVFKNCKGLESIELNLPIAISNDLFTGCSNIQFFQTSFIGNESNEQEKFFAYFFGATTYAKGIDYVPSKLTSVVVTSKEIPANAFYNLTGLTMVSFTGKTVGLSAFEKCSAIKELSLGNQLETIQANAFSDCSGLEEIHLPKTLLTIGIDAFNNTFQASNITNNKKKVVYNGSIDSWAIIDFANNYANPMAFADTFISNDLAQSSGITNLIFENVVTIKQYAFYGFSDVKTIKLASNTASIGESAFANMEGLSNFEAGLNLTSVAKNAFKSNSKLAEVILNANIKSIGEFAFMGCAGLTTLRYQARVQDWVKINFANQTANLIYASNVYMLDESGQSYLLEDVYLDDTVTEISAYAFYASNIKSLHITRALLKIGENAFKNCSNLKTVYYNGTAEEYQKIENNTPFSNDVLISYNS